MTTLIGIAGAFLGTFVGRALGLYGPGEAAGWIMSVVGAILLLLIYRLVVEEAGPADGVTRAASGSRMCVCLREP